MRAASKIYSAHPYAPLFKAWAKLRDAERRRDTRAICQARREIGEVRHALLRLAA